MSPSLIFRALRLGWNPFAIFSSFLLLFLFTISPSLAQPPGFIDEVYLSGFSQAVGLTFDENSRMYVWEKGGKIWIVENGVKASQPLLDISEEVGNWRDFGMLGLALDPNFLTNGYIYVLYIVDRHHLFNFGTSSYDPNVDEYFSATIGRLTRYTAEASTNFTTIDYNSRLVLLGESASTGLPHLHQSHGIGSLVFGTDGTLLVSMGDGASYSSVDQGSASETYWSQALADGIITSAENVGAYRCQMLNSLNGKILRLDPATGDGVPSNPHYNASNPRSKASRVWGRGVRNPCRMTIDPNTGSHDPADGNPGTLYFGDVGWGAREELNVCDGPDQNFGWPKYEGVDHLPGYNNSSYNPSTHTLPKMQWRNSITAQGVINGTLYNVGSSQLPGNSFGGNCSIGGVWYTSTAFPAQYQNTYFHADYGGDWIRSFSFDASGNPTQVQDFKTGANAIVFVGLDPINGSLYWIGDAAGNSANNSNNIHRITYNPSGNLPPIADVQADVHHGSGPLTVNFSSDFSYDPEGSALTYTWDFGDGNSSTEANPSHTFTPSGTSPQTYTVGLTVTDGSAMVGQDEIDIYLNNTPPQILSTSVDGLSTFSHNSTTNISLSAVVSDAEHSAGQLSYTWHTALYHNNHHHNDPPINSATGTATLTPVGCDGVTYWYRITLTVSDPTGLSATYIKDLQPDCSGQAQTITFAQITEKSTVAPDFTINPTASSGLPVSKYHIEGPATLSGNTVSLTGVPGRVTIRAVQGGNVNYKPAVAVERSFDVLNIPTPFLFEKGVLTNMGSNWQTINLSQAYSSPVIVASAQIVDGSMLPAVTRIQNVTSTSFDIRLQNPSESAVSGRTVHYMVFEEGVYTIPSHGIKMEAVIADATITAGAGNWIFENRSYQQSYSNPVVVGQVMSYNDPDWSSFWASGNIRTSPPTSTEFSAGKHVGEDTDITRSTEQIGYLVLEAGSGIINGANYTAGLGADIVLGVSDGGQYNYALTGVPNADVAVVSTAAEDGGNGSWPVMFGPTPLTGTNLRLAIDEDQIGDAERNHIDEQVAYLVMGGTPLLNQTITFDPLPNKETTDPDFDLVATASSGLPVSFSVTAGPATVSGNTISLTGVAGTVTVEASQAGNSQFNAAIPVSQSFEVNEPNTGCNPVLIDNHDFESGWGIWNDGGSHSRRSSNDAAYANSGVYCVRLRDNQGSSETTTDNLDLSAYGELTIDFSYYVVSFDNANEDFWVQISTDGGATFNTKEEWNLGDEFNNDERKFGQAIIQGPFSATTKIRFRCDASDKQDYLYLDDISIIACTGGGGGNQPPVADISATPTSGVAPLLVSFDASGSSDPNGDPLNYIWDFGDGNNDFGVSPSHTYTTPGSYTATVTASDGDLTDNASIVITVSPAGGGSCTTVQLDANDFESGWGIWNDGGNDCELSTYAQYANSGTYCVQLRDNTSGSVMTTNSLNLAAYTELNVAFSYITSSFGKTSDDFWLQISTNGGATWTTVEEWNWGDEFGNNSRHNEDILIPGPFTGNTQVRIRCDATNNGDQVYIDDVVISGCLPSARQANPLIGQGPREILVYPNPLHDREQLTIALDLTQAEHVNIRLFSVEGKQIQGIEKYLDASTHRIQLPMQTLSSGIYLIRIEGESWDHTERILVK